jgi:hypothetical protein
MSIIYDLTPICNDILDPNFASSGERIWKSHQWWLSRSPYVEKMKIHATILIVQRRVIQEFSTI